MPRESNAEPLPSNQKRDLIATFRERYAAALDEAQAASEMTATPAWQTIYLDFRKANREQSRALATKLRAIADLLEGTGLSEESERELGNIKKYAVELRTQQENFDVDVVARVCAPVDRCRDLISDVSRQAQNDEEAHKLLNIGLVDLVRMELEKLARASWDAEAGRVLIQ